MWLFLARGELFQSLGLHADHGQGLMAPVFTGFLPRNPHQALGNLPSGEPSTTSLYNGPRSFLLLFLILTILKPFP